MKNIIQLYQLEIILKKWCILLLLLLLAPNAKAQQVKVLPENGNFSEELSPQGNLLFQRYFYLITPAEMAASGFSSGMDVTSLGFTIAAVQGDTARGKFEIYLQNTTDDVSRADTSWTYATTTTNSFDTSNLSIGTYEWQVQSICPGGLSPYSGLSQFAPPDTFDCNRPDNLKTLSIATNSATLTWTAPYSTFFVDYLVEYRISNAGAWISHNTTDTFYMVNGLAADTSYQWRVRTNCTIGSSAFSATSFSTIAPDVCDEPTFLTVGTTDDTSSVLSWTPASSADYYLVEFRRVGTSSWDFILSFSNSVKVTGLRAGTQYEWRIKTVCNLGEGMFVMGTSFSTSGSTVCYAPQDLTTNVINDSSAIMHWNAVPGATAYNVRYRLKNSISWDSIIAPMILTHNDSITIPDTIGPFDISFNGMGISTFNYSGDGLYIAWEYTGRSGPLTTGNTVLATSRNYNIKDKNNLDSISFVLGFSARNHPAAVAHEKVLLATNLRPQTRLGSSALEDSVEVVVVHAQGYHALDFGDTSRISAVIKNHASQIKTYIIKLRIKDVSGNQIYSADSSLMMAANSKSLVIFDGWVPTIAGTDSIIVFVDGEGTENVLDNNHNFYLQKVNASTMAYDDDADAVTHTGFGTGSGLILTRYKMAGCGSVNGASIYLDFTSANKPVYAVIMNSAGILIDSSEVFIPDSNAVNQYHTFYFPESPFFDSSDFYIGLAQMVNAMPYYPVGVQWETTEIRDSAYYRAAIDGSGLTNQSYPGRLMIKAELVPGRTVPVIMGHPSLCATENQTLSVGSKITRFANQVINVSSEFGSVNFSAFQALGTPDVYPDHSLSAKQWISETNDGQREYIVLGFPNPGPINFIDIYETFNIGAVDTVYVKNPGSGLFEIVYMDTASLGDTNARINHITFDTTTFDVSEIRIAIASDSVNGFNGIDAVGIGLESDTSSFMTYQWSTGPTTNSILISSAGTYSVTVTDALGCQYTDSLTVITPSQIPPIIRIKGSMVLDTTFCEGGMVVLKSDKSIGNIWSTGATSDSIIVQASGSYSLSYNDGTGCGLQSSNMINVTVDTLPIPSITGNLGICPGGGNMTSLDAGAGYVSYSWSNNMTTQTITVSTSEGFSVTVEDGNGCLGTSAEVNTFFSIPPAPSIAGTLSLCLGDSTELDAGAFSSYQWSNGATTRKIFAKTAQNFSVTVTDGSGCIGSSPNVNTIFYPTSLPNISGLGGFCPGGSTTLNASNGFASYIWSTGSSNQSINVNSIGNYAVTVTDNNGCQTSRSKTMVEFAPPKPFIAGSLSFCGGSSVELKAEDSNSVGFISYLWSSGQTSGGIFVDSAGTYSVTVTDIHGCMGDTSAMVVEDGSVPDSPGAISGPDFMPGDSSLLIYSVNPVANTLFYHWHFPEGVTIIGKEDSTDVVVRLDSIPMGEFSVAAANGCGLSPTFYGNMTNFELPLRGDCNQSQLIVDNTPILTGVYIGNTISSAGSVPTNGLVLFKPKSSAILTANFNVNSGAIFEIEITDCGNTNSMKIPAELRDEIEN